MALQYPLINGHRHDFSSAEINVAGRFLNGIKSLDYGHSLEPGELRGNRAALIGRTRGKYGVDASIELYLAEYQELITVLSATGGGYLEASFNITASYNEAGQALVTDYLIGVRLKKPSKSFNEGGDALSVRCDLHVMELREGGLNALHPKQFFRTV